MHKGRIGDFFVRSGVSLIAGFISYDVLQDSAFCHVCMTAEFEKKFLASTKRDPAFITTGYTYWKEAVTAFKRHVNSACHQEAIETVETLPAQVQDIGELLLDASTQSEKALNRSVFKRILQNLCYLVHQGLALRGHGSGDNSNFTQLLQLRALDCPENLTWMAKKTTNILLQPCRMNAWRSWLYALQLQFVTLITYCSLINR